MAPPATTRTGVALRERHNWLIHMLYVRQEYDTCLATIEEQLKECRGMAEYPIYVKALIKRQRGEINESLQLFQAATCLNPHNIHNLKQVGRSLYLLARHKAALDVYEEALRIGVEDWEIWHNKGLCNMYLKQYADSADCFKRANAIQRHDTTYIQLGKVYTLQEEYRQAIDVYLEALEFSPENPELLTTVGLLYLRLGENYKARAPAPRRPAPARRRALCALSPARPRPPPFAWRRPLPARPRAPPARPSTSSATR